MKLFMQRWLSLTARTFGSAGRFRKERTRVLPVWSDKVLKIKVDYFHANPVRRKLVEHPEAWAHSSYRQIQMGQRAVPFMCHDWPALSEAVR